MEASLSKKKSVLALLSGILGCILMGSSDWLMIYGNTVFKGNLAWLTEGVAIIPPWRNTLAMVLSIPAVIFYAVALVYIANFINNENSKSHYRFLTTIGLTPWLCLHLFYTMILYLFSFLRAEGLDCIAFKACEGLFEHFSFLIPLAQVLMLAPFIYLFVLFVKKSTIFNKAMCVNNPLIIYIVLKFITLFMPDVPFRLAFTNALMSEAMFIWFIVLIISYLKLHKEAT